MSCQGFTEAQVEVVEAIICQALNFDPTDKRLLHYKRDKIREKAKRLGDASSQVTINIRGTEEDPLFQANQIGRLLGITNIRESLKDFDEDEKGVSSTDTLGGQQQTLFLTELGLYRLLGQSRKPVARPFQKWVAKVIKEIRVNGKFELEQQSKLLLKEAAAKEEELRKEAEEARALTAAKDAELSRLKAKTYDEVAKDDNVYICKEASELSTDRHKIGKTIDPKKRESQLNTGSAQGSQLIYKRETLNAKLIEDIAHTALRRYHCNREHYNCRVEHSVDVLDAACTFVDTVSSSYEHITRRELLERLIERLRDLQADQQAPPPDAAIGQRGAPQVLEVLGTTLPDVVADVVVATTAVATLAEWLGARTVITGIHRDAVSIRELWELYRSEQDGEEDDDGDDGDDGLLVDGGVQRVSRRQFKELAQRFFRAKRAAGVVVKDKAAIKQEDGGFLSVRLTNTVSSELLDILRSELTGEEQQLFINGFAAYLHCDTRKDFVMDIDDVYAWLGFTRPDSLKKLYKKHLTEGVHFQVFRHLAENPLGGRPKEQTLLTIHGFKQLCMAANTDKGRRVREYYISMEEILFQYTSRKANEEREHLTKLVDESKQAAAAKEVELRSEVEAARALTAVKEAELSRLKAKTLTNTVSSELLDILRSELTGEEQQLFINGFAAYLHCDTRKDFVMDIDDVYAWLGFTRPDSLKKLYKKHLTEGVHFQVFRHLAENPLGGRPKEQTLLTIHGFKQLCMAANTDKGRRVREYYISMEEILFQYTSRKANEEREHLTKLVDESKQAAAAKEVELRSEVEAARALTAVKEAELSRLKAKTYDEVPKDDNVYICKEASELSTDRHKIGKTIDPKKRESQLNTGSAQGSQLIYTRETLNAKLIEDIAHTALRRYHCSREHYNCRVEHSVDVLDAACTFVDTVSSSYEHITRRELLERLIERLRDLQADQQAPAQDAAVGQRGGALPPHVGAAADGEAQVLEVPKVPARPDVVVVTTAVATLAEWLGARTVITGIQRDAVSIRELWELYRSEQDGEEDDDSDDGCVGLLVDGGVQRVSRRQFKELAQRFFRTKRAAGVVVKASHNIKQEDSSFKTVRWVVLGIRSGPSGQPGAEGATKGSEDFIDQM
ncbi:hypothetical protein TSOC_011967 [Tetrabaena socialis]|uniref:Bro-N domain-containing protein n=1 Tax=Tetrabaena socialis TaxID=47790 RepID=A0A2J7ZP87_9CHLO|nr:hypothetical protein TSOC_011967 [Tetrabaena socialis]|eukprot:PNH02084.1 hypothetical protein TSOC_011967 [Tetrabaena socialis]